jgi:hypothetical protein
MPREAEHTLSQLESSMSKVQVDQKTYEMPPREGFTVAHFLTVPTSSDRFDFMKPSSEVAS